MTHDPPPALLKVVAVTQRGETCRGRRSTEGTSRQGLGCGETTRHDVTTRRNPARPHAGSDDWPCRGGAGLRSGTDGIGSRDGAAAPGRRRPRPCIRYFAACPGAHRTHGAPGVARARLRGHEVKLVLTRANPA